MTQRSNGADNVRPGCARFIALMLACLFAAAACSDPPSPNTTNGTFARGAGGTGLPPEDAEFTLLLIDNEPVLQTLRPFTLSIYVNDGGVLVLIGFDGCNVVGGPLVQRDDETWLVELDAVTGLLCQSEIIVNRRDATWLDGRNAVRIKYQPTTRTLLVTESEGTRSEWAFAQTGERDPGNFDAGPAPVETTEALS